MECVVGAWLLKARPLPPSGSGPFPNPTQRNSAPPRGSWPLWAGGASTMPGGPACGSPTRTPRVRCAPGQAWIRGSPATHPGAREAACSRGCSSPRGGGDTRWAHWAAGSPAPGPCLSVVAGTRTPRGEQKGGAPPQDRHTSTFFFLQLGHEVPTHFFFLTHTRPLPNVFFCALTFCSKLTVRRVSVSICHYQKAWG